ncbi:MAG: type ISP restriction/modification enzyme [Cecembia sp.]
MTVQQYLDNIYRRFMLGHATEHSFRGDLQQLIESLAPDIQATNEPKRQSCGAPDYILTKKDIPVGFIEAKDLGDRDLSGNKKTGNKEQFDRYKSSLDNIIFTDYLDFHLYRDGEFVTKIAIAEITEKGIEFKSENYQAFTNLIKDFCTHVGQTIKSPKKLAEMMAGKARLLSDVIEKALNSDEATQEDSTLKDQMNAFKQILIHDITPKGFADVYAQTIAYGMFAARLHDSSLDSFSRQEAAELIPKSNPFLRKLFGYIAGPDIDDRIKWIVDSLAEIFLASDVEKILKNYGKQTKMEDPIIHFYETFLSEYDPKLRKARGVWYTPQPVVNFIVRAVDEILQTEFGLSQGLADTSKTTIALNTQTPDKRSSTGYKQVEKEVHKVQILDPATGTGTFLAEVIKEIHKKFKGQQGIWSQYVENHLIPRLNGFELLMASYAMAHLKLDLLLAETGFKPTSNQRLRVFLTNSLEEFNKDTGTLFANWLSAEANEANHIKRDTPVMVVIGNPPYSVSSTNKGEWIQNLIMDYKRGLNERKINLDDDYIKFIRYGQHFIDKNGEGILAFITNNSFIDGITHRQMRRNLMETFNKIYIIDLHGNTKRNETTHDGGKDENVFDIQQGVSINLFIKKGVSKDVARIFHKEILGLREDKYETLKNLALNKDDWEEVQPEAPYWFYIPKKFEDREKYQSGFKTNEIFIENNTGIQTKRDSLLYHFDKTSIKDVIYDFLSLKPEDLRKKFNLPDDGRDWTIKFAKDDVQNQVGEYVYIHYRPFDTRYSYFTGFSKGIMAYPRSPLSKNLLHENIALLAIRNNRRGNTNNYFITNKLVDKDGVSPLDNCKFFPLYLYPESSAQLQIGDSPKRQPNLNMEIVKQIAEGLGMGFVPEKEEEGNVCMAENGEVSPVYRNSFAPIDLLDYIYAVLHSPSYREKYKEFLKIDFPRVPYPKDKEVFWKLVSLGGALRQIHLLESPIVSQYITQYPVDGDNVVDKLRFEVCDNKDLTVRRGGLSGLSRKDNQGRVYINATQYFDHVPETAWNFYIGGYQPAQKWLKDRKGRTLDFEDILHYQKIIVALMETDRLMKEVDGILEL